MVPVSIKEILGLLDAADQIDSAVETALDNIVDRMRDPGYIMVLGKEAYLDKIHEELGMGNTNRYGCGVGPLLNGNDAIYRVCNYLDVVLDYAVGGSLDYRYAADFIKSSYVTFCDDGNGVKGCFSDAEGDMESDFEECVCDVYKMPALYKYFSNREDAVFDLSSEIRNIYGSQRVRSNLSEMPLDELKGIASGLYDAMSIDVEEQEVMVMYKLLLRYALCKKGHADDNLLFFCCELSAHLYALMEECVEEQYYMVSVERYQNVGAAKAIKTYKDNREVLDKAEPSFGIYMEKLEKAIKNPFTSCLVGSETVYDEQTGEVAWCSCVYACDEEYGDLKTLQAYCGASVAYIMAGEFVETVQKMMEGVINASQ